MLGTRGPRWLRAGDRARRWATALGARGFGVASRATSVAGRRTVRGFGEAPNPEDGLAPLEAQPWALFDRLSFVSRHRTAAGLGGEHRSRARAPSTDFVDHRAYRPGDDFRRVDWNVYGRLGSLHVKVTEARERLELVLVLDCSASMRWGYPDKLAYATRVAAALAYVALQRADVLHLVCLTAQGPRALGPVGGRARFPEVVRFLGAAAPVGAVDLGSALTQTAAVLPPRAHRTGAALAVVISDLLGVGEASPQQEEVGRGAAAGESSLAEHGAALGAALDSLLPAGLDVAVLHVLSPQEESPAALGEVELVDAESGDALEAALSVEAVARYRARFAAWRAGIERQCSERGLRYVRARTDRPVASLLLDDLRRAQVLR